MGRFDQASSVAEVVDENAIGLSLTILFHQESPGDGLPPLYRLRVLPIHVVHHSRCLSGISVNFDVWSHLPMSREKKKVREGEVFRVLPHPNSG